MQSVEGISLPLYKPPTPAKNMATCKCLGILNHFQKMPTIFFLHHYRPSLEEPLLPFHAQGLFGRKLP